MKKKVELYLERYCGTSLEDMWLEELHPNKLSWYIKVYNWHLLGSFTQTITWEKKVFILEVWPNGFEEDAVHREEVPSNIRLEELQIKLQDIAMTVSVKYLKSSLIPAWKEEIGEILKRFSQDDKKKVASMINAIHTHLVQIESFVNGEPIEFLIQELQNMLDDEIHRLASISRVPLP